MMLDYVKGMRGDAALEVGVGSGFVLRELAKSFRRVVGTDVSLLAAKRTADLLTKSGSLNWDIVCCDAASPFRSSVLDLVVFNPPYLPSKEVADAAVDGGQRGIEVALHIFSDASRTVSPSGKLVCVMSSRSDYPVFMKEVKKRGFKTTIAGRKRLFFEEIFVLEAVRD